MWFINLKNLEKCVKLLNIIREKCAKNNKYNLEKMCNLYKIKLEKCDIINVSNKAGDFNETIGYARLIELEIKWRS